MRPADVQNLIVALELQHAELEAYNVALHRSRERYRALYELAPTPFVTVDARCMVLEVNRASVALLASESLVGLHFDQFVSASCRAALRAIVDQVLAAGAHAGCELELTRPDGTVVEVLVDAIATVDTPSGAPGCLMSLVDITARKRAEEAERAMDRRLQHLQKIESMEVLAGGVAHGFNNLLTVITLGAELARDAIDPDSPSTAALDDALAAARRAAQLARRMLEYAGKRTVEMRALDLAQVLRELEPGLRAIANPLEVELDLEPGSSSIVGDASQLGQVVHNLVTNGVEATASVAAIRVTLRRVSLDPRALDRLAFAVEPRSHDYLRIEVEDRGAGIAAAVRARIFEPFFTTKDAGRGLGLAVVQGIVRGHGGAIEVDSALDEGTRVSVWLPATTSAVAAVPRVLEPVESQLGSGTLLVIDDDVSVGNALRRMLVKLGFEVVLAHDGAAALAALAPTDRLDAAILDLTMPGLDGIGCAKILRALRPGLPLVLCTGFGDVPESVDRLFDAVIYKPFGSAPLLATLGPLLAKS